MTSKNIACTYETKSKKEFHCVIFISFENVCTDISESECQVERPDSSGVEVISSKVADV